MTTDISEKGLEALIVAHLTGEVGSDEPLGAVSDLRGRYRIGPYVEGNPKEYDRAHAVDWAKLLEFLQATQPKVVEQFDLENEGPQRLGLLDRLQGEIAKRGVISVPRTGLSHGPMHIDAMYGTPTPENFEAVVRYRQNIFSVTRQLRYSQDQTALALDLALFVNGLPVATFELKNSLTKQTVDDAVRQYQLDRDHKELLFRPGRCMVHFAVDESEVRFCTELKGKESYFLPFNKGWNDGAGNPPNPDGLKTDYLWKQILTPDGLIDIIENYAGPFDIKDRKGKTRRTYIFPRYHQLDVVRKLLAHAGEHGAGQRYLIQHSAGSGKSNSIAWLAHQLAELTTDGESVFDSIVVVTDRKILDRQIKDSIKGFGASKSLIGWAERSGQLKELLAQRKRIIISTVQKFPFVLDEIAGEHKGKSFAIIIDEAHSSQGGKTSVKLNQVLGGAVEEDDETVEDEINRLIESRKMLTNASYFAFTATPKNKTLELFGTPEHANGSGGRRPFHGYSMKQAIDERFILDVLGHYTPYHSYYRLAKEVEGDPEFDNKRAQKKLRRYVESHPDSIAKKARIIVDHFHESVWGQQKIKGQARAMVVCSGIVRALEYYDAINVVLAERKSGFKAIAAFSGEQERDGRMMTEAMLNGFPSKDIPDVFRDDDRYRFLVCADKFQTGYDEPLLHTMYVDKPLSGIKAVQTLSRLNRSHPDKHDTFVLDFANDTDVIMYAFQDYYRTTVLSSTTDPNKLHDLKSDLDGAGVYMWDEVEAVVESFLNGASRELIDPKLDAAVAVYLKDLDEVAQVAFKSNAKAFVRTYNFLSAVLPYGYPDWEKLSIYLSFLVSRLPAPKEDDLSIGVLETVSLDSYRTEKQATIAIKLEDEDATIDPPPIGPGYGQIEIEIERLSIILKTFHERYGNIDWKDADKIRKVITEELPATVSADTAYQNAIKQGDRQNAKLELDRALKQAIAALVFDHSELYKQFMQDPDFKRQVSDDIFALTFNLAPAP